MEGAAKVGFRTDIQALRGIAVLLVLFYHSGVGPFASGYLGVDLFFVISGYLITGIIARGVAADSFSFAGFYTRRARRLLPAAYVVLLATTLGSALLLSSSQYANYSQDVTATLAFMANFSLWSQTGYFAPNSSFNPLLHMWSLAVEEQYYLFIPLLLSALPRRTWLPLLAGGSAASLAACLTLAATRPSVAFFWLPPRAWELGLGSIAALLAERSQLRNLADRLVVPAAAAILLVPTLVLPGPTPVLGAMLVCVAASMVVLSNPERWQDAPSLGLLARVGDISYSLYLVHWPLFALARASRMSRDLPVAQALVLLFLSLLLGWTLHRLVEEPVRRGHLAGRRLVLVVVAGSTTILLLAWGLGAIKPRADPSGSLQAPVVGLKGPGCFDSDPAFFDERCTQSRTPAILLWGDSYAAHLVPGLLATSRRPIVQAAKGHCTPFVGVAAVVTPNEDGFSRRCLSFNGSVIEYLKRTPSVSVVILSGQYFRFLPSVSAYAIRDDGREIVRSPLGLAAMIEAQRHTVAAIRGLGRRVVVVSPPPPIGFDAGQCWQRLAEHLPIARPHADCRIARRNPERSTEMIDAMTAGFVERAGVPVISLDEALCTAGECAVAERGRPIFRDEGHLTRTGSLLVGRRLNLGERVWAVAR